MTQEEELLMKDLCARQPYKVKISIDDDNLFIPRLRYIEGYICHFYECSWIRYFDTIKPYLRTMSSMTKEEKKIASSFFHYSDCSDLDENIKYIDWLNEHHFDYRGLIPMGLALEAPEDMYK